MAILQSFGVHILYVPIPERHWTPTGWLACRNDLGAVLALCLPAAFTCRGWRVVYIPLILAGLLISRTVGAVGATALALLAASFFCGLPKKTILVICLLGVASLSLFVMLVHFPITKERIALWDAAWVGIKKAWVMGYGIGHWQSMKPAEASASGFTVHNEYLQAWFEMGIGAVVLIGAFFVRLVRRYRREALLAFIALLTVSVNALVHFPFHEPTSATVALIWIAIYDYQTKGDTQCQTTV
jgi:O-antigen ligase